MQFLYFILFFNSFYLEILIPQNIFLEPENLLCDICSLGCTLTLRYRELTVLYFVIINFKCFILDVLHRKFTLRYLYFGMHFEISRADCALFLLLFKCFMKISFGRQCTVTMPVKKNRCVASLKIIIY